MQIFWHYFNCFGRIGSDASSKTKKQTLYHECNILNCVAKVQSKVQSHVVDRKGSKSGGPLSREQQQTNIKVSPKTNPQLAIDTLAIDQLINWETNTTTLWLKTSERSGSIRLLWTFHVLSVTPPLSLLHFCDTLSPVSPSLMKEEDVISGLAH